MTTVVIDGSDLYMIRTVLSLEAENVSAIIITDKEIRFKRKDGTLSVKERKKQ